TDTLQTIHKLWGNRRVSLARELTKMYEQFIRGPIEEVLAWAQENTLRGECVIVIEGSNDDSMGGSEANWWASLSLVDHVAHYEQEKNLRHKDAMRAVAKDRNISRRDVYDALHVNKKD